MQPFRIIVEKHPDGYVAYPEGIDGVVIGEGDTYEKVCRQCHLCHTVL